MDSGFRIKTLHFNSRTRNKPLVRHAKQHAFTFIPERRILYPSPGGWERKIFYHEAHENREEIREVIKNSFVFLLNFVVNIPRIVLIGGTGEQENDGRGHPTSAFISGGNSSGQSARTAGVLTLRGVVFDIHRHKGRFCQRVSVRSRT
jgi:hypothetical protein